MFEAKIASAALLKKIIDAIKDLVTDVPLDCSEQGICIQSMDSSHVALVSLNLEPKLFERYRCDRSVNIGMSLANMAKALKCANNDDSCEMKHDEATGEAMIFSFFDEKKEQVKDITVKLMDIDGEHLGIPDQDYAVNCEMSSAEFRKICTDMAMFGDSMRICATKGSISFSAGGDSGSNVTSLTAGQDENEGLGLKVTEPADASFSIKYLVQLTKASTLSDRVKFSFSKGSPIVLEYCIEEGSHLRFFLAPKLEDDEGMDD